MKDYLVTIANETCTILVLAKDAKDAINQAMDKFPFWRREDFSARSLGSLHNEFGKIVEL